MQSGLQRRKSLCYRVSMDILIEHVDRSRYSTMVQLLLVLLLVLLCLGHRHGTRGRSLLMISSVEILRATLVVTLLWLLLHLLRCSSATIKCLLLIWHLLHRLLSGSTERVRLSLRLLFWRGTEGICISLRLSLRMCERSVRLLLLEHHLVLILQLSRGKALVIHLNQ